MNETELLQLQIDAVVVALETAWTLLTGIGILVMQVGFAMLEAGAISSKNVRGTLLKGLSNLALGAVLWLLFGYGLFSGDGPFASGEGATFIGSHEPASYAYIFQQFAFAATATAMVSGAIIGRCKFWVFIGFTLLMTGFIYPIQAHWAWARYGWLAELGFLDFAGGSVVHMFGGCAALAAAIKCGPRVDRFRDVGGRIGMRGDVTNSEPNRVTVVAPAPTEAYSRDTAPKWTTRCRISWRSCTKRHCPTCIPCVGILTKDSEHIRSVRELPGHSIIIFTLGGLFLYVGWFYFNVGSVVRTESASDQAVRASRAALNTLLCSGAGTSAALAVCFLLRTKLDLLFVVNAMMVCSVAITPGSGYLYLWVALVAGPLSVLVFTVLSYLTLYVFGVDDPLDVFSVHGGGAIVGMLLLGLLHPTEGWAYTGDARFFGIEILGLVCCGAAGFGAAWIYFSIVKIFYDVRYSDNEQYVGLDELFFEVEAQTDLDWVSVQEFNVRERYNREKAARQQLRPQSTPDRVSGGSEVNQGTPLQSHVSLTNRSIVTQ